MCSRAVCASGHTTLELRTKHLPRTQVNKGFRKNGTASWVRTLSRTQVYLLCSRLLYSCPTWCLRRMSFQPLFGDTQSLLVQVGLLCHVPYLRDYYRPENQQSDGRRDGLLAEDPYPCLYSGPVCYRLYLYVQGGLHAYDGLEGASTADAHLHPSCRDVCFGYLVVLALEVTHHLLSNRSEVLNNVGNGLGRIESPHLGCLLLLVGVCALQVSSVRLVARVLEPPARVSLIAVAWKQLAGA